MNRTLSQHGSQNSSQAESDIQRIQRAEALGGQSSLKHLPDDDRCFDCNETRTTWASISNGVWLCLRCAGNHRSMGVDISIIRSLALDEFNEEDSMSMQLGGNMRVREVLQIAGLQGEGRRSIRPQETMQKYNTEEFSRWRRSLRDEVRSALEEKRMLETRNATQEAESTPLTPTGIRLRDPRRTWDARPRNSIVQIFDPHECLNDSAEGSCPEQSRRDRNQSWFQKLFRSRRSSYVPSATGRTKFKRGESVLTKLAVNGVVSMSTYDDSFGVAVDIHGRLLTRGLEEGGLHGFSQEKNSHGRLGIPDGVEIQKCRSYQVAPTRFDWSEGNEGEDTVPVEVHHCTVEDFYVISTPVRFKVVAAGQNYAVAICENGNLYSWGSHDEGRLGLGRSIAKDQPSPTLVTVMGRGSDQSLPIRFVQVNGQVTCGFAHTLALTSSGRVYAWGTGLGKDGATWNPTLISSLANKEIVQVTSGMTHSCVLSACGRAYAFGENVYQECSGTPSSDNNDRCLYTPRLVASDEYDKGMKFTHVACGRFHTVFLDSDGIVYGQGLNSNEQLGHRQGPNSHSRGFAQVDYSSWPRASRAVAIAAQDFQTAILTEDREVYLLGAVGPRGSLSTVKALSISSPEWSLMSDFHMVCGCFSVYSIQSCYSPRVDDDLRDLISKRPSNPDMILDLPSGETFLTHRYILQTLCPKLYLRLIDHARVKWGNTRVQHIKCEGVFPRDVVVTGENIRMFLESIIDRYQSRDNQVARIISNIELENAMTLRYFIEEYGEELPHSSSGWFNSKLSRWRGTCKADISLPMNLPFGDVAVVSRDGLARIVTCMDFLFIRCPHLQLISDFSKMRGSDVDTDDDGRQVIRVDLSGMATTMLMHFIHTDRIPQPSEKKCEEAAEALFELIFYAHSIQHNGIIQHCEWWLHKIISDIAEVIDLVDVLLFAATLGTKILFHRVFSIAGQDDLAEYNRRIKEVSIAADFSQQMVSASEPSSISRGDDYQKRRPKTASSVYKGSWLRHALKSLAFV